ncbi:FAD binding domain-containing protein [Ramlibacter algicola]|uniref:Xanthine dehydrogenase family protein subunit M n=1 Tax=Ramlibacter algicola TaxID=2795217 RepID=A0A934UQZ0_9BURK|nr:xanthine dehydrogenase family protein subunit M [Ramlibacter algicola]MBK0392138.1 xanthine dehydrogenase family protein subunit M [Ramlibacter algicola]
MKPPRFDYEAPASLEEALQRLRESGDDARVLAGGQSLIPALNLRLANPGRLLDLRRITSLRGIRRLPSGALAAGAMTRHADFERDPLMQRHLPIVPAVMRRVAHPQIRNRGTIGGSLAHADPAAEWPALCMALDATIVVASASAERRIPAAEFPLGVYTTALRPGELIREIEFPAWPATRRWGFEEVSRRLGDFAITGAMCTLDIDANQRCTAARCVIFAASERPQLVAAAAELVGGPVTEDAVARVAKAARHSISPLSDHHASAEYRLELVETMTARVLKQAAAMAAPTQESIR